MSNTNYSLNSQIAYNWVGTPDPIEVPREGEDPKQAVPLEDFVRGMGTAEEALGQKILQDNNNQLRILKMVSESGLVDLATDGSATSAQLAAAINKLNSLFTNLVIAGKE
jgi:hypothetical protein